MRVIILFVAAFLVFSYQTAAQDSSKIEVVKFEWSMRVPTRQIVETEPPDVAFIKGPETLSRQTLGRRESTNQAGDKTIAERSSDLRNVERDAVRSSLPEREKMFLYELKVKNADTRTIKSFIWEYQIAKETASPDASNRRFLCAEKIKSGDSRTLKFISYLPPSNVVDAIDSKDKSGANPASDVSISYVEYTDGTFWQRADWENSKSAPDSPQLAEKLKTNDCAAF